MLIKGNALRIPLADGSVDCVVTSPPYWGLRDYGLNDQIGLESTPDLYVESMLRVFAELRRVLRDEGTVFLNLGDTYASTPNSGTGWASSTLTKPNGRPRQIQIAQQASMRGGLHHRSFPDLKLKDLCGIPWRVAFALQADGWWLRSDIIWHKPNPMPESVTDRPTRAHEYIFLLTKSARYWYDAEAVMEPFADERMGNPGGGGHYVRNAYTGAVAHAEPQSGLAKGVWNENGTHSGRNRRSVWTVATRGYAGAHYAVFPEKLIEPCILAGCPVGGVVFDPFVGSGTTVRVAEKLNRRGVGLDLSYQDLAVARTSRIQRRLVAGNDVI